MNTAFLLMAQYGARAIIPIEIVARDYFPHLGTQKLVTKIDRGEVKIPLVRIEASNKAARGVHLGDLANWIDARRDAAARELEKVAGDS
jgi:hypothetical protein